MPESKRLIGPAFTERRTAARMTRSVREFMELEVAGGTVLLAAVIVALLWANSPWKESYETLWTTELEIGLGAWSLGRGLRDWVNEGLMTGFFFVIGLEIKRELVKGELSSVRRAALPAAAALGGMILPAGIFLALNVGSGSARGWGIPIATDVALALGVLAILGSRVPGEVRILLLSVAIVDDIGAIIVIAVFYSGAIEWASLAAAGALVGLILGLRVIRVWWIPAYVVVGSLFWLAMLLSGVHSTIAGVVLGLLTPVRPLSRRALRRPPLPEEEDQKPPVDPEAARVARARVAAAVPVDERLQHALHPWTSFAILPLFALANGGISLSPEDLSEAMTSFLVLGIMAGLVVGKLAGVVGSAWIATRLGGRRPSSVGWQHLTGLGGLAGIGFTMSLFISELAFQDADLVAEAKVGILLGSILAAGIGAAVLLWGKREDER